MAAPSRYAIAPLGPQHDRKQFACGEPSLDDYIQRQAGQDVKRDLAACFVLSERDSAANIGYYTLSASSVEFSDLPTTLAKKSGRYAHIPAVLLGRLAVDRQYQGQGMSGLLLVDALRRIAKVEIGVKLVIVDALNDSAASYYEHYGFTRFEDLPMRLYLPTATIRELYPEDTPTMAATMAAPGQRADQDQTPQSPARPSKEGAQ